MLVHELVYMGKTDQSVFTGKYQLTYGQLQEKVLQYRNYFYQQGIRPGDKVGLFSKNSPEFIYSYLAIVSLRAVVVPLNFQLAAREIAYIVQDAGMKTMISMNKLNLTEGLTEYGYQQSLNQLIIPEFSLHLPQANPSLVPEVEPADEHEICAIIYTSGTTGKPKGAMLNHRNLISNVLSFTQELPVCSEDVVLCVLPMYHGFSWTCPVLGSLMHGATIVIADTFSKDIVATIRDNEVTIVYAIPAMYSLLLQWAGPDDFRSVHLFASGGGSLPEALIMQFRKKFGQFIYEGYGLSEASPGVCFNPPEKIKPGSIGKALPGISVRVVDQMGTEVPTGECGELLVYGPNVMQGYYNLPEETARTITNGWLHTGDIAYQDEEGYVFIKDRLKDMIIINGENVYPREVEELLCSYPSIAEAAVIGIDHQVRGQVVVAMLVLQEGQSLDVKDLRQFLLRQLANYKVPKFFVTMKELPKNSLRKVLKQILRQQAKDILTQQKGSSLVQAQ